VSAELCGECGSPLASGQRYCLICGARAAERPAQLIALLSRLQLSDGEDRAERDQAPPPRAAPRPSGVALRLPARGVSALLVAAFLGFGIVLGEAARTSVPNSLAASVRRPLRLVLPARAASSAPEPGASAHSQGSGGESEAPETAAQETPAPAATASTQSTSASTTPAPSTSTGSEGSGSTASGSTGAGGGTSGATATKLPVIRHVFVIMLSDEPYAALFGPESKATYLAGTLEHRGTLLVHYDAVAHGALADELALISGQGPTAETAAECPNYANVAPATSAANGQTLGNGCVYPTATQTLAGQLSAKHLRWRAYVQGVGEGAGTPAPCAHPSIGQADPGNAAASGPYATSLDPFVYFHSLIDSPACAADDGGLVTLRTDLASAARTPSFSYIAPNLCHNGSPTPCTPGAPAGVVPADTFLKQVVPEITASAAYRKNGLIVITAGQAPSSGELADSSSCCGQPAYPNLPAPTTGGRGGGAVGALLLSPFLKGAVTSQDPYNHFSMLRTIEDLFSLAHLGYAALPAVKPLEPALFYAARTERERAAQAPARSR